MDLQTFRGSRSSDWLTAAGVVIDGSPDIRRLRKSTKVEKALAFGGRIADVANDHHEEVFRGHYAQGTTLRVMSGQVITTAQDHWFAKAVDDRPCSPILPTCSMFRSRRPAWD